jgi:putative endonuclease
MEFLFDLYEIASPSLREWSRKDKRSMQRQVLLSNPPQISLNKQQKERLMEKQYYIYIMANERNTTVYTGVTGDLKKRVYEHKGNFVDGFTKRYNVHKLVYYEVSQSVVSAIEREKQIKGRSRAYKNELITQFNPDWRDLFEEL